MRAILSFFVLIRWPNLALMALTQYFLYQFLLMPTFDIYLLNREGASLMHFILILSSILIAAAGYIINDYFDVKLDIINKPQKVIVGRFIKRRWAIILHISLSLLGVLGGFWAAKLANNWMLGLLFVFATLALWRYSEIWKRQLLIGNLCISMLTGLLVLIPYLFEVIRLQELASINYTAYKLTSISVMLYVAFSFWLTLIRELIKDIEDREGDAAFNCRTLPIVWGHKPATYLALSLLVLPVAAIAYLQLSQIKSMLWLPALYLLLTVQIPLLLIMLFLVKATDKKDFSKASLWLKIAMLGGILSMMIFHFI